MEEQCKICFVCKQNKPFSQYSKHVGREFDLRYLCIPCEKRNAHDRYMKNREDRLAKRKVYCETHKEERSKWSREYWLKNEERLLERARYYRKTRGDIYDENQRRKKNENLEAYLEKGRRHYHENKHKPEYKQARRERYRKWSQRPENKIAQRLRGAMRRAVKEYDAAKKAPTLQYLGCSVEFLIEHLKSQLKEDMTWENVISGDIHIDHIKPMCSFDLTKEEELYKVCHYTNLQPLWEKDNLRKISQDLKMKFDREAENSELSTETKDDSII